VEPFILCVYLSLPDWACERAGFISESSGSVKKKPLGAPKLTSKA